MIGNANESLIELKKVVIIYVMSISHVFERIWP